MNNDEFYDSIAADDSPREPRDGSGRYSLRGLRRLDYSATAKGNVIDSDTPKLSAAIASEDRAKWLEAIADAFNTIRSNKTRMDSSSPPPSSNFFLSGVILRIKQD